MAVNTFNPNAKEIASMQTKDDVKTPDGDSKNLTAKQLATIHRALARAGLRGFKINTLHLKQALGAAPDPNRCHSERLSNGDWVIVCE